VNLSAIVETTTLATIQAALVALPGPSALRPLRRLASPAWALLAPGSLVFGTFGVLALPPLAGGLVVLAALATPVLAAVAVLDIVRGRHRNLLLVPLGLAGVAVAASGWPGELAASLLTALGCLTLGTALVSLTPARWLRVGLLSMAAVDILLLGIGVGQHADALLSDALSSTVAPGFDRAEIGNTFTEYPDLVLAGVLGGIVAGRAIQTRVAALVAIAVAGYGALLAFTDTVPATVPLVLVLLVVEWQASAPRQATPAAMSACQTSS
jgi:hypothetical protein